VFAETLRGGWRGVRLVFELPHELERKMKLEATTRVERGRGRHTFENSESVARISFF